MEKTIYQDENGLYFVEYDQNGNPKKIYCDETGNPLVKEDTSLEIFQQEDGSYYYVAYNELGEAYKVPCDENGKELTTTSFEKDNPYVAPVAPIQNTNQAYNQQQTNLETAGAGAAYAGGAVYQNQTQAPIQQQKSGNKSTIGAALVAIPLLFGGGYYAYSQFLAKPVVNMSGYTVDVKFTGKEGEGKAEAKVTAIPDVKISDASKQQAIDDLLTNADITYSKESGLKNGDKVAVNIDIDPAEAEAAGVKVEGNFKKTVTVGGLTGADSKSSSSSSDSKEKTSSESEKKPVAEDPKPAAEEPKRLEYKQVYNTGYKGLLMRTGPSQSYPAISTLFDGTPVQVLEYNGSWAKVNYNGMQGWMYTGYLR